MQDEGRQGQRRAGHSDLWHHRVAALCRLRVRLYSGQSTTRQDGLQYRHAPHRRLPIQDEHSQVRQLSRDSRHDLEGERAMRGSEFEVEYCLGRIQDVLEHHACRYELDGRQQVFLITLRRESIGRLCRAAR
jgi:hypothetical protein